MAVTFLEVARSLVYDEAEKAAFTGNPAGYLAARGLDGLDADDVADAVRLAVDNLPASIARDVTSRLDVSGDETHGLAALAATEPSLTDLADPDSLDGWSLPIDADQAEAEAADDIGDGAEQDGVLESSGGSADPGDAGETGDAGEAAGDYVLADGFGEGSADIADADHGDEDPAWDGHAAPAWDIDASDGLGPADPVPTHETDQPAPIADQSDAGGDVPSDPEIRFDDGTDPDDLGL